MEDTIRVADPDPVGSGDFVWIRIRFLNFSRSDPVCYKRLDPDPDPGYNMVFLLGRVIV